MIDDKSNEYKKFIDTWVKVNDCVAGQEEVKNKAKMYLPQLNGQDDNSYSGYLSRAQYENFTGKALQGATGQIFRKNPIVEGFEGQEEVLRNIDLSGMSFNAISKVIFNEVMKVYRVGIFIDYSDVNKRPFMTIYKADAIINWDFRVVNDQKRLSQVVLREFYKDEGGNKYQQLRELFLDEDNVYSYRLWRKKDRSDGEYIVFDEQRVLVKDGFIDSLPFFIVTADGINPFVIKYSPLNDISNINLGHYKNSADYENMLHWTGAKTLVTKGLDGTEVKVGGSVDLPIDGDAFYLEASSDSGLKDEMRHKEELISAMSTALLTGRGRFVASAETSRIQASGEMATLSDISNMLSDAMTTVMKFFGWWLGLNEENISVSYNTDFEAGEISEAKMIALSNAYQSNIIPLEVVFTKLKQGEIIPDEMEFEEYQELLEKNEGTLQVNAVL